MDRAKSQAINKLKILRTQLDDMTTMITVGKSEHERICENLAERFEIKEPEEAKGRVRALTNTLAELTEKREKLVQAIELKLRRYE